MLGIRDLCIFIVSGLLLNIAPGPDIAYIVAALSASTARRVRQSSRAVLWINRAMGSMFVYPGTRMALLQAR
jgi:threonine/homoserine/homoserine lactone efflux protein